MKIAILANSIYTVGGEQRVVVRVANYFSLKNDVTIYTHDNIIDNDIPFPISPQIQIDYLPNFLYAPFHPKTVKEYIRKLLRKISRTVVAFPFKRFLDEKAYLPKEYLGQWISLLEKNNYDVIIGIAGFHSLVLSVIGDKLNAKTIGWEHSTFEAYYETKGIWNWNIKHLFKKYLSGLDACVVLGSQIKERYREEFNVLCNIIPNCRTFELNNKAKLDKKNFLAIGRLSYEKGFDILIKGFALFSKKISSWNLMIIGDGPEKANLDKLVQGLQVQDKVIFCGNQVDIEQYYLNASLYLIASRWEGQGITVLEAMEAGVPVIGSNIPAIKEIIRNDKEGLIVKENTPECFCDAMLSLVDNMEMMKRMQSGGIQRSEDYSPERIFLEWDRLLERLAG